MAWINPNFLTREVDEAGQHIDVYLAADPDACFFGQIFEGLGDDGQRLRFHFPERCNTAALTVLTEGSRIELMRGGDILPYEEVVASFKRFGRHYTIGSAGQGRFFVHCKVDNNRGLLAAI